MIPGSFEAVVSRVEVVSKNLGLFRRGCFEDGVLCLTSAIGHKIVHPHHPRGRAAGLARLCARGDDIVAVGRFDIWTPAGRAGWKLVRTMQYRLGWSVAFDVLARGADGWRGGIGVFKVFTRVRFFEVSPTLRPAMPGTRTTEIDGSPVRCW